MTVVNLNKAKKARARADKKARADENAIRFGRTKAEKQVEATRAKRATDKLDGHKRDG